MATDLDAIYGAHRDKCQSEARCCERVSRPIVQRGRDDEDRILDLGERDRPEKRRCDSDSERARDAHRVDGETFKRERRRRHSQLHDAHRDDESGTVRDFCSEMRDAKPPFVVAAPAERERHGSDYADDCRHERDMVRFEGAERTVAPAESFEGEVRQKPDRSR